MEGPMKDCMGILCFLIVFVAIATSTDPCDAGTRQVETTVPIHVSEAKASRKLITAKYLDHTDQMAYSKTYVGVPITLTQYKDVLGSTSRTTSLQGDPIYCIYPPPQPPPTPFPSPIIDNQPPMPLLPPFLPPIYSTPPIFNPNPPNYTPTPNPPEYVPSPPRYEPNPPIIIIPGPPTYLPSPVAFVPTPPLFQPPIVYPPPTAPPPPPMISNGNNNLWCIAKPSVPDPILQEALDYACGSGADCNAIQPDGPCYEPNTVIAHASFAFNSYWQRTRESGGTCDFGGIATLVPQDPSFDGCHFIST